MPIKMNILIVDDHPFIIEGYKNALKGYNSKGKYDFTVTQAKDCKTGYEAIIEQPEDEFFGLAFFDLSMPIYEEKSIFSGEDLAVLLRNRMPDCKIILLTMHTELMKISAIVKNVNPNGLVIKNDLTYDELLLAIDKILKSENYYSQTIIKLVSQINGEGIEIDEFDMQILSYLSKGTPTKTIPQYLPFSLNVIEKRKEHIKELLKIPGGNDVEMIKMARELGLVM